MSLPNSPCEKYRDGLAEFALGMLTGRERAETLAHVEGCSACADEVEELSRAADELLQVAPEAEPPVGFEVRLLEHFREDGAARASRRSLRRSRTAASTGAGAARGRAGIGRRARLALVGAAAAVVVAAGVAIGLTATNSSPPPHVAAPASQAASLMSINGTPVGRVVSSKGDPPWLFMVVDSGTVSGSVTCRVELADGHWVTLGTFSVEKGYGMWAAPLPKGSGALQRAQLVDAGGGVVAWASFPASAA